MKLDNISVKFEVLGDVNAKETRRACGLLGNKEIVSKFHPNNAIARNHVQQTQESFDCFIDISGTRCGIKSRYYELGGLSSRDQKVNILTGFLNHRSQCLFCKFFLKGFELSSDMSQ